MVQMASQLSWFLRRDSFSRPRLTCSILAKWMAHSCPILLYSGASKLRERRELLFQLRTLVTQITPSISRPVSLRFSSSKDRPWSSLLAKSKFLVMLCMIEELRWRRQYPPCCTAGSGISDFRNVPRRQKAVRHLGIPVYCLAGLGSTSWGTSPGTQRRSPERHRSAH